MPVDNVKKMPKANAIDIPSQVPMVLFPVLLSEKMDLFTLTVMDGN